MRINRCFSQCWDHLPVAGMYPRCPLGNLLSCMDDEKHLEGAIPLLGLPEFPPWVSNHHKVPWLQISCSGCTAASDKARRQACATIQHISFTEGCGWGRPKWKSYTQSWGSSKQNFKWTQIYSGSLSHTHVHQHYWYSFCPCFWHVSSQHLASLAFNVP